MGAHLGDSGECAFTEQTDRELVCIVAKAPTFSDHSHRISRCRLGGGSAPRAAVGCGPYSVRTCAHGRVFECLQLFGSETCLC